MRSAAAMASSFERAGLSPVPGLDDYFQPFRFTSGVRLVEGGSRLETPEDGELAIQERQADSASRLGHRLQLEQGRQVRLATGLEARELLLGARSLLVGGRR